MDRRGHEQHFPLPRYRTEDLARLSSLSLQKIALRLSVPFYSGGTKYSEFCPHQPTNICCKQRLGLQPRRLEQVPTLVLRCSKIFASPLWYLQWWIPAMLVLGGISTALLGTRFGLRSRRLRIASDDRPRSALEPRAPRCTCYLSFRPSCRGDHLPSNAHRLASDEDADGACRSYRDHHVHSRVCQPGHESLRCFPQHIACIHPPVVQTPVGLDAHPRNQQRNTDRCGYCHFAPLSSPTREYRYVAELPKTSTGKISKVQLREG